MITIEKYILNIKFKIYIYINFLVVNPIQSQEEPPGILAENGSLTFSYFLHQMAS